MKKKKAKISKEESWLLASHFFEYFALVTSKGYSNQLPRGRVREHYNTIYPNRSTLSHSTFNTAKRRLTEVDSLFHSRSMMRASFSFNIVL